MGGGQSSSTTTNNTTNDISQNIVTQMNNAITAINNQINETTLNVCQQISNSSSAQSSADNTINILGLETENGDISISGIKQSSKLNINFTAVNQSIQDNKFITQLNTQMVSDTESNGNMQNAVQSALKNISDQLAKAQQQTGALGGMLPLVGYSSTDSKTNNNVINKIQTNISNIINNNTNLQSTIQNIINNNVSQISKNSCDVQTLANNTLTIANLKAKGQGKITISDITQDIQIQAILQCMNIGKVGSDFANSLEFITDTKSGQVLTSNNTSEINAQNESKQIAESSNTSWDWTTIIVAIVVIIGLLGIACFASGACSKAIDKAGSKTMLGGCEINDINNYIYKHKEVILFTIIILTIIILDKKKVK